MAVRESRVALLCIDPMRNVRADFRPFNYSVRKVQAAVVANPALHAEVTVFEHESTDVEEYVARIEAMDPDIVGASAYVWSFPTFHEVARALKRARPDRLIVYGGPSARVEMFNLPPFRDGPQFVDALVLGEGEDVFQEIVGLADRSRDRLRTMPGLAVSTGDGWFLTPSRELPVLDTLASPFQMGLVPHVKTAHLETFRGCPLSCTFCQWGDLSKANRVFSVDYLVRELGAYKAMGLRSVLMVDAALNLNLRAFRNLREAEREVGFFKQGFLHAEVYPQYMTDEHLDFLREIGGGSTLGLGLQSYNKEVLGNVERPFDEKRFERVVREIAQVTSGAEIEIIMGLPGDDPESFRTTLHRALGLGTNVRVFHCLVLPNALMSRAPASFDMEYDPIDLAMISCLGWKGGAIQRMVEELNALSESIPGSYIHNQGYAWLFPASAEQPGIMKAQPFSAFFVDPKATTGGRAAANEVPPSVVRPVAHERSGAVVPGEHDPTSATDEAYAEGPPASVEPALRGTLVATVSQATTGAWQLIDVERETELLALKVATPFGEVFVDVRPAIPGRNAFKVLDGTAYSYRRTDSDMPAGAFKQIESIIAHLHPLHLLTHVLCAPEPPLASPPSADGLLEGNGAARRTAGRSVEVVAPIAAQTVAPETSTRRASVRDLPRLKSLSSVEFDADSLDLAEAARAYHEVGFIVVRGLLRSYMEPMLAEIRQAVDLAYQELPEAKMERHGWLTPSGGVFSRVGVRQLICVPLILRTSPTMRSYVDDRRFVSLLDELLAREVHQIGSGQVMYKVADGGVETGLHQDASYTKDFGFTEVLAAFTYVVPTPVERGCIWLVPYSHRLGLLPHQEEGAHAGVVVPGAADWEHAMPIPGNPGDTLIWHFNVLHGSQPNVTAEDRPAVVVRYGRGGDAEVLAEHGLQDW